jgi:predicted nucleic acid-binding protein
MVKTLVVIVDADAIIAQANPQDAKYEEAISLSKKLIQHNAKLLYPITAIAEATTYMQRVLNSGATAYGTAVTFLDPNITIVDIDQKIYQRAVQDYFKPKISKKDTLFDCIIAAVADEYQADMIFSFDKFYKKKGFKIVADNIL